VWVIFQESVSCGNPKCTFHRGRVSTGDKTNGLSGNRKHSTGNELSPETRTCLAVHWSRIDGYVARMKVNYVFNATGS
jgi:hypothetical protein